MTPPVLHPTYYLDHFRAVRADVAARYAFLLDENETARLSVLSSLSEDAACLYARLTNRRGPCFRLDRLEYPEISDLKKAIAELCEKGLLDGPSCGDSPEPDALDCFTAPEIAAALAGSGAPRFGRRGEMLAWIAAWDESDAWLRAFLKQRPVIRLRADDPWDFFRFLFFGERVGNLSGFVVRELGHLVPETVAGSGFQPLFKTRREAVDAYRLACLYEGFRTRRAECEAVDIAAWWRSQSVVRPEIAETAWPWFDRLCDRLGRLLERAGEIDAAIEIYAQSPVAPCRERLVRLWTKQGRLLEAEALLAEMTAAPCHAEEAYAAAHLTARAAKRSRRSPARAWQIDSPQLILEYEDKCVEAAVLAHYAKDGWDGIHAEGWPWNALFGLLLWEVIYDPAYGGFHQPLQLYPSDLHTPAFYATRRDAIERRLARLAEPDAVRAELHACFAVKEGVANPFVFWHPDVPHVVERLLRAVAPEALAAVLRRMAGDYRRCRRGFPDLFLWRGDEYAFVEVKAEGDQLAAHQYQWLRFFGEHGIVVRLEKVRRPGFVESIPDRLVATKSLTAC